MFLIPFKEIYIMSYEFKLVPFGDICMTQLKYYLLLWGVCTNTYKNILPVCVCHLQVGQTVSIKSSVWLTHNKHSSILHFAKGKLVWGEISCFYHTLHVFIFCKYWLSCLSFEFSDIFSVWFYGDLHDYVSCNRTGSLLNPYFKSYFSWITQFYFIFHSKKYTNIGKVVAELYVCKRM